MGLLVKVLITGDKGFVGRAFHRRYGDQWDIDGIDLKSGEDCRDAFRWLYKRYDLVIHLAAIVGGRLKIENDPLSVATDLSVDSEMFNWAVRTKQPRVVYYSSSAAYPINIQMGGRPKYFRLNEDEIRLTGQIREPDQTYGWVKLTGEMLAKYAAEKYGLKTYVFRPFSGYGTDQDLDYPFPSFMERAQKFNDPFVIWGNGNATRDFVHINDVVDATVAAVEQDFDKPVNLCTGRSTNFNQLADLACDAVDYSPDVLHLLDKPVGALQRVGNPARMEQFYTPKITLEQGIRMSLDGRL